MCACKKFIKIDHWYGIYEDTGQLNPNDSFMYKRHNLPVNMKTILIKYSHGFVRDKTKSPYHKGNICKLIDIDVDTIICYDTQQKKYIYGNVCAIRITKYGVDVRFCVYYEVRKYNFGADEDIWY